jgi:hypothetical protein
MVDSCRATHRDGILATNVPYRTFIVIVIFVQIHVVTFHSQVLLGHVSQPWRAVSLTTRKLRNHIDIYTPHSLRRASGYIERSGPHFPLDIYINLFLLKRLVSGENYTEPWWNQEHRLNA